MLSARALAAISDDLIYLYSQLEADIKKDMFRRLAKMQKVTDATLWQAEILKQTGGLKADIDDLIKKYDKKAQKELKTLFYDAMDKATESDLKKYTIQYKEIRDLSDSQAQRAQTSINRLYNAETINKTYAAQQQRLEKVYNSLTRMTMTVASHTETEFLKQCNAAFMKVNSGAFSINSAYKQAVNAQAKAAYSDAAYNLSRNGVKTILYDYSGTKREYSIEAATRMNVLTGINLAASQQTLENADLLGTTLIEVDAHYGARPSHEALQGKVYSRKPEGEYFTDADGNEQFAPNFEITCRFGEPDGICGINCRHSFYPYIAGAPLSYSNKELDEYKEKTVTLDGKKVSQYEGEQALRLCEENIRKYKGDALAFELTNNTDDARYIRAKNKIYEWQGRARKITEETGLQRKYINEYIGTPDGKQPTGAKPTNTKALKDFANKPDLEKIATQLAANNVYSLKVDKLDKALNTTAIVNKLAGGDKTAGSCSSLALSFAANYGGYDVTDYRGGGSRKVFATTSNIVQIAKLKGVESSVVSATNDVKAAWDLLGTISENKYYYLAAGRHAAIVKKTSKGYLYLEMQSSFDNGFKELTQEALKKRFKCRTQGRYTDETILIECLSLAKNKDFIKLMEYINTNEKNQLKGTKGSIK